MSKKILKFTEKYKAAQEIIQDRTEKDQLLGYNVRPFIMTPLPYKKSAEKKLLKKNGDFFFSVKTSVDSDLPYGQDRLVISYIITKRKQQGKRTITFGSPREYFDLFKIIPNGINYKRLIDRIERVFHCWFNWGFKNKTGTSEEFFHFFDKAELWYKKQNLDYRSLPGFENKIKLSEQFDKEITNHSIPVELKVLAELKESPVAIDIYSWAIYRAWQLKKPLELNLWGARGFIAQTNIKTENRKQSKVLKVLDKAINQVSLYCPDLLDLTKDKITLKPKKVINKRR